jgi:hypothetical protein
MGRWVRVVGEVRLVVAAGDGVAQPWGGGKGEERRGLSSPLMAGSVLVIGVPADAVD